MGIEVLEGTVAEIRRQLDHLPYAADQRLRVVITDQQPTLASEEPFHPAGLRNGVPLLPRRDLVEPMTLELVKRLEEDEPVAFVRLELPDVNVLIALMDPAHVHHETASRWFATAANTGWATCPLTENGPVRVLSNPAYPGVRLRPADAIALLETTCRNHAEAHHFWPDRVSLREPVFHSQAIAGPGQITDVYLLGLCQQNDGTLVTPDARITTAAITAPHPDLLPLL